MKNQITYIDPDCKLVTPIVSPVTRPGYFGSDLIEVRDCKIFHEVNLTSENAFETYHSYCNGVLQNDDGLDK